MQIILRPKTKQQLMALSNPLDPNQPEIHPHVLYDTQVYVDNTTTSLEYFTSVQQNKSLGNMESAGQLPDPQFFEIHRMGCDIYSVYSSAAVANSTSMSDLALLLFGALTTGAGSPRVTYTISNKTYGPWPLRFFHASGGITGFGWGLATNTSSYQNNGIFDGGFPFNGSLVIPPKIGFKVNIDWGAVQDLSANVAIMFWMAGVLYRRVL